MAKIIQKFAVVSSMGKGWLQQFFAGKTFLQCLIELIKNARDWHATLIMIAVLDDIIRLTDNGRGMNEANRNAFASINLSTAVEEGQSGKFCTGSKFLLVAYSIEVEVLTAPEDDPDYVYRFRITTAELEALIKSDGKWSGEKYLKTPETWPHLNKFKFGTQLTYKLKDPKSRALYRGLKLAQELSVRLPLRIIPFVEVDGHPIPPKEVVGSQFQQVIQDSNLGPVSFELYRPKRRTAEDELRLGSVEIGEISMSHFQKIIGPELRSLYPIPDVFFMPEVCGTGTVGFLKEYANEDRQTLNPAIANDPRTLRYLKILQQVAPDICRKLQIRMVGVESDQDQREIDDFAEMCNANYNPGGKKPPDSVIVDSVDNPDGPGESGVDDPAPSPSKPFSLECDRREYEIGETIKIRLRFSKAIQGKYLEKDITWNTTQSFAGGQKKTSDGISLVASRSGSGKVAAEIFGTPYNDSVSYRVVTKRMFRLNIPGAEISVGSRLLVTGINLDKLKGQIVWEHRGVGKITPQGGKLIFDAIRSGRAEVIATDTKDKEIREVCNITVTPSYGGKKYIWIKGICFQYDTNSVTGTEMFAKPATMIRQGDESVHRLVFNTRAPGYELARQRNTLFDFLSYATGIEFVRFFHEDLNPIEAGQSRDIMGFVREIQNQGCQIFEEILTKQGGKN